MTPQNDQNGPVPLLPDVLRQRLAFGQILPKVLQQGVGTGHDDANLPGMTQYAQLREDRTFPLRIFSDSADDS